MLSKKIVSYVSLFLVSVLALVMLFSTMALEATAVAVTGVSGVEVTVDSNGSISESSGTVTVTAKGSFTSAKTATITVTNTSGSTANISFDYSGTQVGGCSLGGVSSNKCSGTKTYLLTAGSAATFTITSRSWTTSTTVTMTLSNFKVETVAAESNVTVTYGSLGSVKLDGTTVASGSVNAVSSSTGGSFVAVPGSGSKFVAWINPSTNAVLSTSATYQLIPTEAMSIRAVFANASAAPVFWANGTALLYESFDAAISYASSASNKTIVLAADGTLPARDDPYVIPSGVTVLIPYDSANTLCETDPAKTATYVTPTVYRTLTMASGANITANGAISIAGTVCAAYDRNGMPSGPLGFIKMNSGSTITVNSGAFLYAWGYITGSGSVTVNSGGTVYECFQLPDFRGGDATTKMTGDSNANTYGVFPFNQYYVQNIEVPLTLHAGAKETALLAVNVSVAGIQSAEVPFIGADESDAIDSMFTLTNGYLVKDYREGTGRTDITIYGDVAVSPITVSIKVNLIGSVTIESQKYELPISNHYSVYLESGTLTLGQDIAFLPGSEFYIKGGAICVLGSGVSVYVYDLDQWVYSAGRGYAGRDCQTYDPILYAPGGLGTEGRLKDALIQIDGTLDASAGYVYVTEGGANIYSAGNGIAKLNPGSQTTTYQVLQYLGVSSSADDGDIKYAPIVITPAKLKNANPTQQFTETSGASNTTYYYCLHCGMWLTDNTHSHTGWLTNVSLANNLHMYFAYRTDSEPGNYTATVTHYYADGSIVTTDGYALEQGTINGNTYIRLTYTGVAAKEMVDAVYVTLYDSTGKAVAFWGDSIEAYALRLYGLSTTSDKLKTVIVDMLNYGAACQDFFDYNEGHLANAQLTPEQQAIASADKDYGEATEPSSEAWFKSQLVVESSIRFRIAFTDKVTEGMYVSYSFVGHKGNTVEVTKQKIETTDSVIIDSGTHYYVMIDNLVVADAAHVYDDETDFIINIDVYASESTAEPTYSFSESIKNYVARLSSTDVVYKMFMRFSASSHYYLHNRGGTQ